MAASGSRASTTTPVQQALSAPATGATYRQLMLKGLAPDEAANLTAWLCGIHVGAQRWRIAEVNRLLFLRGLSESGRFGGDDGASAAADPAA